MVSMVSTSIPTISPTWATTRRGEPFALLSQEHLVIVQTQNDHLRAYCPIHGSDRQASLSVNSRNGFGVCFACGVHVLVAEWNPEAAARLFHVPTDVPSPLARSHHPSLPTLSSPPSTISAQEWQAQECQTLRDLAEEGLLRLDRPEAWNARAYLEARAIPVALAQERGVGYLEKEAAAKWGEKLLRRWEDRLLFPLLPADQAGQTGFAGRLLTGWQSCVDEVAHKKFLEYQRLRRWLKTCPAGWFWTPADAPVLPLIVVEGPLDRLACLASGFAPHEVLALVGTALQAQQLPPQFQALLLAFDGDQGGRDAAQRLEQQLQFHRIRVESCLPGPDEGYGKDWSARWRRAGSPGLDALYAHHALMANQL